MKNNDFSTLNRSQTTNILSLNSSVEKIIAFKHATVVDIILDTEHPYFTNKKTTYRTETAQLIGSRFNDIPMNYKSLISDPRDVDISFIGRAKIRILDSEIKTPDEKLPWAICLDSTITQYPLINEQVLVIKLGDDYFYTKPLNNFNFIGTNVNFSVESSHNITGLSSKPNSKEINENRQSYTCFPSKNDKNETNKVGYGYLGNYFILNPYIRSIKKHEGDTVIESRFGQSIKMSAYDDDRKNDNGLDKGNNIVGSSYTLIDKLKKSSDGGFGNPRITIRNKQRNIAADTIIKPVHPRLPAVKKIDADNYAEKNYGGQIEGDINNDGSTIDITSGVTKSNWKTTVYKSIFSVKNSGESNVETNEEQSNYCPEGATTFEIPILNKDQIIINTDRLILSSRLNETMHFSKKRYAICTDSEYTVDANNQIVLTTNNLTCINSPQIFLGQWGETNEPALLGQTTTDWLYDLCNWLLDHVHWYHHVHPHPHGHVDAGRISNLNTKDANPDQTQIPVQQLTLKALRDNLHKNMSRRVYLTGGGYAPGSNGVKPAGSRSECEEPIKINLVNGSGVVGNFKGRNRREGPLQIQIEK